MVRKQLFVVALAALMVSPMGVVLAQNETNETEEDGIDANETEQPDLEVEELRVMPEDPRPGEPVRFFAELANDGDADAGAFNVSFALDGERHSVHRVDGIPADGVRRVASDPWNASAGEHEVTALADSGQEVPEEDEENNAESESFDVEPREEEFDENETEEQEDEFDDENETEERESAWDVNNDTYTGEFIQVTVAEELPGLRDVNYLDPNASVFASVELSGDNFTHHAQGDFLTGETRDPGAQFVVRDEDGGHLMVEAAEGGSVSIDVADGVQVNESERFSDDDEDEAVYRLHLENNRTAWLTVENATFDNGTFEIREEAHLRDSFGAPDDARTDEERREERRERMEERREERRERMEERREIASQWNRSNGSFEGEHVLFEVGEDNASIENYAIRGSVIPVFAEAALPANETSWSAHGKAFELRADDARLRVIDVPPSILMIEAGEDANASLAVADGVEVERIQDDDGDDEDEDALWELSLAGNRTGWVFGEEVDFENGTFTIGDRAMFRSLPHHPEASENRGPGSIPDEAREERGPPDEDERGPPEAAHRLDERAEQRVQQAVARGEVGVEVHVGENDTEPVAVEVGEIEVRRAWLASNGSTRAGMTIEAPDGTPGTTVTMNLDESKLGNVSIAEAGAKLSVRFDNETIELADDLDDVLDPNDDEGTAEYLLLVGGDEVQVLVSVPHFSPHTIEVYETQSGEEANARGAPGFGAASLVAAGGLAALALSARRPD